MGGFTRYGNVNNDFLMIKGSVCGATKRTVTLRKTININKRRIAEEINLKWITASTDQGGAPPLPRPAQDLQGQEGVNCTDLISYQCLVTEVVPPGQRRPSFCTCACWSGCHCAVRAPVVRLVNRLFHLLGRLEVQEA